jgi:hypothetical protein
VILHEDAKHFHEEVQSDRSDHSQRDLLKHLYSVLLTAIICILSLQARRLEIGLLLFNVGASLQEGLLPDLLLEDASSHDEVLHSLLVVNVPKVCHCLIFHVLILH